MPTPRRGALVSLSNNPHRPESSVIYISTLWKSLVPFLKSPIEFLKMEGSNDSPVDWNLLSPATVILKPMFSEPDFGIRDAFLTGMAALTQQQVDDIVEELHAESPFAPDVQKAIKRTLANRAADHLQSEFKDGGYIAEFATLTRILTIRYFQGDAPSNTAFSGQLDPPTLATVDGSDVGNIHFDITPTHGKEALQRAEFVVHYIEGGVQLMKDLNLRQDFAYGSTSSKELTRFPDAPNTLQDTTLSRPSPLNRTLTRDSEPPVVTIEYGSLSDLPSDCGVCIDGQIYSTTPTIYIINGIVVKCYRG